MKHFYLNGVKWPLIIFKFYRMHFGKIVKHYSYSQGLCAEDLSVRLGRTVSEILILFEKRAWTLHNINAITEDFNHDFLKYLEYSYFYSKR